MRMIAHGALAALACLALVFPLAAQETANVAGTWEMTNETARGTQTSTFTFEQEGSVLTGSVEGRMGSAPISSGSVEGNVVTFSVIRGRANSQTMEFKYTGTVDGDTITGSMTTPRGAREFTMKRIGQ